MRALTTLIYEHVETGLTSRVVFSGPKSTEAIINEIEGGRVILPTKQFLTLWKVKGDKVLL